MGVFDQAARFASQCDPQAVVERVLAVTKALLRFKEWADTRTLPQPGATDRTADLVAVLTDATGVDNPWLLVLEFQAQHDPDKLDVTLEEIARLRLQSRHGQDRRGKYRVLTGLIYLQGKCPNSALDMTLPEGFGTKHTAMVWDVAEDKAEEVLAAIETGQTSWGMLFWLPLMYGGEETAAIARWRERVMALEDRRRRGDLAQIALVFAELAGRYAAWEKGLEGLDMTESKVVNRWIETAVRENNLVTTRKYLIQLLNSRFPDQVSPEVAETVNTQPSLSLLEDWFGQALKVSSFADFVRVLRT